ncbi:MAG: Smr/MutS family protein [Candidatus Rokubacteria bacterium]|nr:Smr/MutS family protein [Candidatus Rokubacteria bacterium]
MRATLDRARTPGAVADGADLRGLIPLLEAQGRLVGYGRSIEGVAPDLSAALRGLPPLDGLRDLLWRSLDDDGGVTDEASPALRRLRRRLRELRRDLVKRLEAHFQAPGADLLFQERYVTVRHGRYVLPILAAAKGRLRGIVHDRSQSGATLFVEPEAVVEDNNELVQAIREEESEVWRVLAVLTDAVREALPELHTLLEGLGRLDLTFALADLAERMRAVEPALGPGPAGTAEISLRGARHPLLLAQGWQNPERPVVPVDLVLDAERPLLVITGPNAGGKTVALKTLGLFALMAQSGFHLPACDGARLPVFEQLFTVIGDDQSVAENLSTFSAFVRQLRVVLEHVDHRSLVLLDELGAGTDPEDGAALAQAVLEEVAGRGAFCVASTHLEPLKAFASTDPRARNASVEFDGERLEPTFRLVYDRPGQSYALAIGARLGLPPALIDRAQAHRSTHGRALQELLTRLDARDRQDAGRAALIERREAESAGPLSRAREELETARSQARESLTRARAEAQRLLGEIRRAVNEEWEQLKRSDRTRESLERSRKRLLDLTRRASEAPAEDAPGPTAAAAPGDHVQIVHLGLEGEVLTVDGAGATVRAGSVTVKVPVRALRVLEPPAAHRARSRAAAPARRDVRLPEKTGVAAEIQLIGRTADEARDLVEKYLDDAFLAGLPSVRVIHGKGTGTLRRVVHELLAVHPLVAAHRPGAPQEGGEGATIASLRVGD